MTETNERAEKGHWWILGALILGVIVGLIVNKTGGSESWVATFQFIGDLFLRLLKMVIVPLIFSSIVVGIAGLGKIEGFGRLGAKTFGYYALTSFLSIVVGLAVVNLVKPGLTNGQPDPEILAIIQNQSAEDLAAAEMKMESATSVGLGVIPDLLQRMIPPNILAAASDNSAMLALIFVALLTAFALAGMSGAPRDHLLGFFEGLNTLTLIITHWIMKTAPIGVFGLIAAIVAKTGLGIFGKLTAYFFTVIAALGIHLFIILPLVLFLVARVKPWRHLAAMRPALLTAFSTASSSATLPVSMRCIQENAGVSKRVTSFTVPLGATVNMDGTALYECVAVLFVAQVLGQGMDFAGQFMVVVLALLTSIGVAGVPSASLVAIIIILNNTGIEGAAGAIAAILAVDRPLDMARTAVNIFSDSCGAVVIANSEGEELAPLRS